MHVEPCRPDERSANEVRVRLSFHKDQLSIKETPFGLDVRLKGCTRAGEIGGPALPRASIHIAVPEGTWPASLDVRPLKTVSLTAKPAMVAPLQPPRPGDEQPGAKRRGRPVRREKAERECQPPRDEHEDDASDDIEFEAFPAPPIVPPDPGKYAEAANAPLAQVTNLEHLGFNPVVRADVRPVRYGEDGRLELVTECEVVVTYGPKPEPLSGERLQALLAQHGIREANVERLVPMPEPKIVSRGQARRLAELAKGLVVNPEVIGAWADRFPLLDLPADYLIITDNRAWNAETITPGAAVAGDMVAAFRRLADWKRSRGITAKVVTITDIVGGRYGSFRAGARDLQEVIRNFLKWAHEHWGVAWVLLGGDVNVLPARLAAGAVEGHMDLDASDPPADNKSHWTGTFLKMNAASPGTWWRGSWQPILTNAATGQPIPFDSTGATATNGGLGWYYTTNDTYATRSTMATQFVRVNGPASVCNARMQWLYEWNRIPTDFYYASLQSWVIAFREINFWFMTVRVPYVYFPAHDWDALDNGLYGQYVGGQDADGVIWRTDVSVGRAPVSSGTQATTFVEKVIAYEKFRTRTGGWLDGDWPRKLVMAASNWGDPVTITPTASNPPEDNRYRNAGGQSLVKLQNTPGSLDFQLIADISDSDRRELPFKPAGGAGRGWYYARSATDLSVSEINIVLPWFHFRFPIPTQWIVVNGTAQELTPRFYLLDSTGQDGSMADQETLREQLAAEIPGWDRVTRYYKDETDLTPAQAGAAPVQHLTTTRIQAALNAGPHVVSLSGHGSPWGCCGADTGMASALTNEAYPFIGYADSCLTSQFDGEDAFAEELLKNDTGGAVAYVGNSRFSWIGLGDDHQRAFFHRLTNTRHIGLANDMRVYAIDMTYWHAYARWCIYALNLLGDPEMQIWRARRRRYIREIEWNGDLRVPVVVKVKGPRKPKPGEPVETFEDVVVHLRQGDFERVGHPDREGRVVFDVQQAAAGTMTLTISAPDAIPHIEEIEARGPLWFSGCVACVSYRHEGRDETRVTLATDDGTRSFTVSRASGDYAVMVNAATEAHAEGKRMELMVASAVEGAVVERFRMC